MTRALGLKVYVGYRDLVKRGMHCGGLREGVV